MDEGKNKRITALKNAAEDKRKFCSEATDKAIIKLINANKPLTIANVAREAGVSTSYIYKYPDLKERIQSLKNKQNFNHRPDKKASDNSKNTIIYNLKEEIKRLRKDLAESKQANQVLIGKLYDYQNNQTIIERLKAENNKQAKQIQELQAKLSETCQELETSKNIIVRTNHQVTSLTPKIEQSIKKNHIDDEIKHKLSQIGARVNTSLNKIIQSKSKLEIINAISAVEEYIATGKKVKSKAGLLRKALEENWMPNLTDEARKINQVTDSFSEWFKLAKEEGIVQASQGTKDGILVLEATGEWTPLETILEKGWTLEYLQKRNMR
ncbi:MAG: DUF6262 family protein [Xenococcaceae cyanobacterium MO_234.B1]|nr:DUF6262 family protein [Xenococcaceae cyanobacterium MO_234.B1]